MTVWQTPGLFTAYSVLSPELALNQIDAFLAHLLAGGIGGNLPLTGGTMTGPLILAEDPLVPMEAVTKQYVDNGLTLYAPLASLANYLPLAGGTLTGNLTVQRTPAPRININKTSTSTSATLYGETNGVLRWGVQVGTSTAETGGNAGSNFAIVGYDDSGNSINTPIQIARSTGVVTFVAVPVSVNPANNDNSTNVATTAYVQAQAYAPIASPQFTGTPQSTTPATADNSNNIATTAYVQAQGYAVAANYLPLTGGTLSGSLNMTAGTYQYNGSNFAYVVTNGSGDNLFLAGAGNTSVSGWSNSGNGLGALAALTSGATNIAIGRSALTALTTGSNNGAYGYLALTSEQTGSYNFGLGIQALNTQNGASRNVGVGALAGYDLTTGSNNVCIGYSAGRGITTGAGNTVIGYNLTGLPAALASTLVLGAGGTINAVVQVTNAFYGSSAGNLSMTGTSNTAIGYSSGHALTSGSNNVSIGTNALLSETTGSNNVAFGRGSLQNQNGGTGSNTAIGYSSGNGITTGSSNTFIGANAGLGITTGSGNLIFNNVAGLAAGTSNCAIFGVSGLVKYDWNYTTANAHTFTGGPLTQNVTPAAGATPVFQSAGALSQASATTNTPALPASRTNGWLMIAFCRVTGATGTTLTCPTSGWTQIVNNAGGGRTVMAAYAYVTGSEVAPVFTLGTSDTSDAQVVMYSGTAASNPIGASAVSSGASVTTLNLTGITTTRYNSKVIASILCNGLTGSLTPPAAFTQQASNTDGAWFDSPYTTAGTSTGTQAFTCSPAVTNWGGFLVELLIPPMTPVANRHNGNVLGTTRWSVQFSDGTQESGSNAGSNFGIQRFSDAGATIDTPISINRATGQTTITNLNPAVLLRSYLTGLALSTAGASTTFTVAAGIAVDSTNANIMSRASSLSKTTSAWAVGSGTGSLDTGAIAASTWYHVFLIMRTDTGVVDVLTSLSATAPTLPTNYTLFRRIGSMLTNASSQWTKFLQVGDIFEWDVGVQEINGGSLSSGSAVTVTLAGVPTGVKVVADLSGYATCTTAAATISAWDADITGSATNNILMVCPAANAENGFAGVGMYVNTSAQFKWQSSANFTAVNLFTVGWIDRRGRDA